MIKEKYEVKTHTVTEKTLVSEKRYCDVCGAEITGAHWEIITGHHDWGNDSCESIHHKDACSENCLTKLFVDYCTESKSLYNTQYFEVEHSNWADVKGEIEFD